MENKTEDLEGIVTFARKLAKGTSERVNPQILRVAYELMRENRIYLSPAKVKSVFELYEGTKQAFENYDEFKRIRDTLKQDINKYIIAQRIRNVFEDLGIRTIGDLVKYDEAQLLKAKNFGKKSLTEVTHFVDEVGLSLGMNVDSYLK